MENAKIEQIAEQIYTALVDVLKARPAGLLVAVADLREGLPFPTVASKTRELFYRLAENLTRLKEKASLNP